jgi:trans-aconitate methyltransferase
MHDLSEDTRITVATTELAGVLFEHDGNEVEARLAAMVKWVRKHHAVLVDWLWRVRAMSALAVRMPPRGRAAHR